MQAIPVTLTYDFICPWCWIGHANLAAGASSARLTAGATIGAIRYVPFELNPWMPPDGQDRRDYRTRKFGTWTRSQELDAHATAAGIAAGLEFRYTAITRTPNTRLAHRLMQHAAAQAGASSQNALFDAIFSAYFSHGRDIGSLDTLVEIAREQGLDADSTCRYLLSDDGNREIERERGWARERGMETLPTVLIGDQVISGAQPPDVFAQALDAAARGGQS